MISLSLSLNMQFESGWNSLLGFSILPCPQKTECIVVAKCFSSSLSCKYMVCEAFILKSNGLLKRKSHWIVHRQDQWNVIHCDFVRACVCVFLEQPLRKSTKVVIRCGYVINSAYIHKYHMAYIPYSIYNTRVRTTISHNARRTMTETMATMYVTLEQAYIHICIWILLYVCI